MPSILAPVIAGAVLAALAGGTVASVTMTQARTDQGKEAAHVQNMTSDLQHCQTDLVMDAGFTVGRYTQADAANTVAACKVTTGTVLTVQVSADGRNFTLVATSDAAPDYTVVADSAAGGAAQVTAKGT